MRSRISIRRYVRPSVCRSVRLSVRPSVQPSVTDELNFWYEKSNISTKMEQNSTKNMKLYHLRDNSETSTWADRQNASDVWTPSDLFLYSLLSRVRGLQMRKFASASISYTKKFLTFLWLFRYWKHLDRSRVTRLAHKRRRTRFSVLNCDQIHASIASWTSMTAWRHSFCIHLSALPNSSPKLRLEGNF